MTENFTIRKAEKSDALEFAACHISAWQSAYRGIIPDEFLAKLPDSLERRIEQFLEWFNSPNAFYYVPAYNGKIIGKLVLWDSRDEDKPNTGEIGGIYLLEEYWNRGFGRQMMNFALNKLGTMGYKEIFLWVLEENTRARQFYEKCGFATDGAKKEITIGKPLVEIRYVLAIEHIDLY